MMKRDLYLRVTRLALMLEDYNYTIESRKYEQKYEPLDVLSRSPLPTCLLLYESDDGLTARLRKAQTEDESIIRLFN